MPLTHRPFYCVKAAAWVFVKFSYVYFLLLFNYKTRRMLR